ncbi:hypothetical protein [Luteibaculum oceani]|uniref:hypothetical protein n=1 Tax=Luteibaculum oceani TaxID=1294296 RepID=UPI001477258A|nr:hypothetical protein [Luteibaculum oceani]
MISKQWINAGLIVSSIGVLAGAYINLTHRENSWGVILVSLAVGEIFIILNSRRKDQRIKELEQELENKKNK